MSAVLHTASLVEPQVRALVPSPAEKQYLLGQFFSAQAIADLLASFVKFDGTDVRMLEAGAGAGALIAATVRRACAAKNRPRNFAVDAWEIDDAVIPALRRRAALNCNLVVSHP